jgi:hypothetical protein
MERWQNYTIVPANEIAYLQGFVRVAPPGDIVVCGSFRGGDVMALREAGPTRRFVVIDSFEGLPEPGPGDDGGVHQQGEFSAGGVLRYFMNFHDAGYPPPEEAYGCFITAESLREVRTRPTALLFLDLDLYQPTIDCIRYFWDSVVPGGRIFTHDYGWPHTPGIARAVAESGLAWSVGCATLAFTEKPVPIDRTAPTEPVAAPRPRELTPA